MKKLFVIAAVMLSVAGIAMAGEVITAPVGANSNVLTADYGGVDVFRGSFTSVLAVSSGVTNAVYRSIAFSTVTANRDLSLIYGVNFSSGSCSDFVDIFQSTGGFVDSVLVERIYNVGGSTVGATSGGGGTCAGFQGLGGFPIRVYGNIFMKASSAIFNTINLHYWKEP